MSPIISKKTVPVVLATIALVLLFGCTSKNSKTYFDPKTGKFLNDQVLARTRGGDEVVSVPLTEATAELKLVTQDWYDTAKTFFG